MKDTLSALFAGATLTREQASAAMSKIMSGTATAEQIAAFLGALRSRGETLDEVVGFAQAIRSQAVKLPVKRKDLIDTCGTGGDGADTFNISTAVAFVAAGMGLGVAKHGNRSVSSRCGSADVLEALGIPVELSPESAARAIDDHGFAFLFAPQYHPALKHAGPVRKALGVRTVFNLLGPLANPAAVPRQVLGVYDPSLLPVLASALKELGSVEAWVVSSPLGSGAGLDELSLAAPTEVAHLKNGNITRTVVKPEDAGLKPAPISALKGGDANENAAIIETVLRGSRRDAARDVVLLNAAAAAVVAGLAANLADGVKLAAQVIDAGKAWKVVERARKSGGGQ